MMIVSWLAAVAAWGDARGLWGDARGLWAVSRTSEEAHAASQPPRSPEHRQLARSDRRLAGSDQRRLARSDHMNWKGKLDLKPGSASTSWVYIHIPKAAGVSFMKDSPNHMCKGCHLQGSHEKAAHHQVVTSLLRRSRAQVVIFLRAPIKLMYSQFLMCKCHANKRFDKLRYGKCASKAFGFERWVDHHLSELAKAKAAPTAAAKDGRRLGRADAGRAGDRNAPGNRTQTRASKEVEAAMVDTQACYVPTNMQARFVVTASGAYGTKRSDLRIAGLADKAIVGLDTFAFVGVTDLYTDSMALFRFASTGLFPSYAKCDATAAGPKLTHEKHGLPPHSAEADIQAGVVRKARTLVGSDILLYEHALNVRFPAQIKAAEKAAQASLQCFDDRLEFANQAHSRLARAGEAPVNYKSL